MSISTRTGDDGTTALRYGRRVRKTDPRVEAYGTADELNAALGVARASAPTAELQELIHAIQADMIPLCAGLAIDPRDLVAHPEAADSDLKPESLGKLDAIVARYEDGGITFRGFVLPGESVFSGALHLARAVCRRAERAVWAFLDATGAEVNPTTLLYLNRLSDVLWLIANEDENRVGTDT